MKVHAEDRKVDAPKHGSDTQLTITLTDDALQLLEEGMKLCWSIEDGKLVFSVIEE